LIDGSKQTSGDGGRREHGRSAKSTLNRDGDEKP
jgi:hypothetical protein